MERAPTSVIETQETKFFPIRPEQIRAGEPGSLLSTFGKAEVETRAERLVLFFRSRGCWCSFTETELRAFYREHGWDDTNMFYGLYGPWLDDVGLDWVDRDAGSKFIEQAGGVYNVTDEFIMRCSKGADPSGFLKAMDEIRAIIRSAS